MEAFRTSWKHCPWRWSPVTRFQSYAWPSVIESFRSRFLICEIRITGWGTERDAEWGFFRGRLDVNPRHRHDVEPLFPAQGVPHPTISSLAGFWLSKPSLHCQGLNTFSCILYWIKNSPGLQELECQAQTLYPSIHAPPYSPETAPASWALGHCSILCPAD